MKSHILIIDDDKKLNSLLEDYLPAYGYSTTSVTDPVSGLKLILSDQPDLVILDVMLPDMDGFEVLREIRKDSDIPVLMLTARGEVTDRVVGLELGADDYLPKPFEPRELVARIQSVLRRHTKPQSGHILQAGELILEKERHSVSFKGRRLDLTSLEFDLLLVFMQNPGKVLSRDSIMERTHKMDWEAFNRTVDVLVSRLRTKLGENSKNPQYIKTIWGKGYTFIGEEEPDEE
jgi:DNA-binding response OmpR family regulator